MAGTAGADTENARADHGAREARTLRTILLAGVLLRIAVFVFLEPTNNDPHWEVVEFIVTEGRLPLSLELTTSFHPPLYYLMAASLAALGTIKLVQGLSLLLSIVTLYLLYRLIRTTRLLRDPRSRCHALMLTAILPQFVLFGLFVSNDGLSFMVGTLCYIQAFRYIDRPTRGNLALLGAVLGAGLLTKGTFLAFGPALLGLALITELRKEAGVARVVGSVALFLTLVGVIGSYKYVENMVHLGRPMPRGEDMPAWARVIEHQQEDPRSRLGPGLLYLTFWYSYIDESNFDATRRERALPGAIYLVALAASLFMTVAGGRMLWRHRTPGALLAADVDGYGTLAREWVVLYAFGFHLLLVLTWAVMHGGAWSFYQARLTFPAFLSIAVLYGRGFEFAARWRPAAGRIVHRSLWVLYGLFGIYYAVEIGSLVRGL